ncbi:hypothetical protein ACFX2I_019432 [Malus domestica]
MFEGPKLSESARTFTIINNCKETVWPAVTPGDNLWWWLCAKTRPVNGVHCPAVKANGKKVGCRSACDVFDTDEYCCRGSYGNAVVCKPTYYSKKFKEACPTAYSYAYDDLSSIFTCSGTNYVVAFCSTRKQQVCTYHHHKLVCGNGSGSVGSKSLRLWAVMIGLLMMINQWINF